MEKADNCQLLSVGEVAERLSVSVRTVWRLIKSGSLRARKIGAATRVAVDDLREFVDKS